MLPREWLLLLSRERAVPPASLVDLEEPCVIMPHIFDLVAPRLVGLFKG